MQGRFGAQNLFVGEAVQFSGESRIRIGRNVTIHPGSQIVAGKTGYVTMGDGSHVSRNTVLAGSGGIEVGDHSKISSGVMIYTVTYERGEGVRLRDASSLRKPVKIGAEVHIGANATILPGVTIGNNAVIGAGAVVSRDVAADTTVVGVPAKPVKKQ